MCSLYIFLFYMFYSWKILHSAIVLFVIQCMGLTFDGSRTIHVGTVIYHARLVN